MGYPLGGYCVRKIQDQSLELDPMDQATLARFIGLVLVDYPRLCPRYIEAAYHVCRGMGDWKQVADAMGITYNTLKAYVHYLFRALKVRWIYEVPPKVWRYYVQAQQGGSQL